ncbi:hypothetical protein BH09ACT10_BH09ACT10_03850 [soil metagenome]
MREAGRSAIMNCLRIIAVLLILISVQSLLAGSPAAAHATLLFSTPSVDSATPTSPRVVQLFFDEAVSLERSSIRVADSRSRVLSMGSATGTGNDHTLQSGMLPALPPGTFRVDWEAGTSDGDLMAGTFNFSVGNRVTLAPIATQSGLDGETVTALTRWIMFVGLALALGGLVGERIVQASAGSREDRLIRSLVMPGSIVGMVAALAGLLAYLAEGSTSPIRATDLWGFTSEQPGRVISIELAGFAAAFGLRRLTPRALPVAVALLAVPIAEGFRAHPGMYANAGVVLTAIHLTATATWLGALLHVLRASVSVRRIGGSAAPLFLGYARSALGLFLITVISGAASLVVMVPPDRFTSTVTGQGWSRWLVLKIAIVVLVACLAVAARHALRHRRLVPTLRLARVEAAAILVVIALSTIMTVSVPPKAANAALPFAPTAVGPTVSGGSRAGQIGVGVIASAGQVVIRLTSPATTLRPNQSAKAEEYGLAVVIHAARTTAASLNLRPCGGGCFVGAVSWKSGASVITVKASSTDWAGGKTALTINWPSVSGSALLKQVVLAMKSEKQVGLYEQVTSNTEDPAEDPKRFDLSGTDFLESEPYGNGAAVTAELVKGSGSTRKLQLSYPSEGIYALIWIDKENRIIREILASPNHLVSRAFVY